MQLAEGVEADGLEFVFWFIVFIRSDHTRIARFSACDVGNPTDTSSPAHLLSALYESP